MEMEIMISSQPSQQTEKENQKFEQSHVFTINKLCQIES